jgi:hypothetical protein
MSIICGVERVIVTLGRLQSSREEGELSKEEEEEEEASWTKDSEALSAIQTKDLDTDCILCPLSQLLRIRVWEISISTQVFFGMSETPSGPSFAWPKARQYQNSKSFT